MSNGIGSGLDIDAMPPDELRRRLRDALREIETLKNRYAAERASWAKPGRPPVDVWKVERD